MDNLKYNGNEIKSLYYNGLELNQLSYNGNVVWKKESDYTNITYVCNYDSLSYINSSTTFIGIKYNSSNSPLLKMTVSAPTGAIKNGTNGMYYTQPSIFQTDSSYIRLACKTVNQYYNYFYLSSSTREYPMSTKREIKINNYNTSDGVYIGDDLISTIPISKSNPYIYIGGLYSSYNNYYLNTCILFIYDIVYSENGIEKIHYIPCYKKSTNQYGLLDIINNTFKLMSQKIYGS